MNKCPLCQESTSLQPESSPQFYICNSCGTVFRHPDFFISSENEKKRYLQHENDVDDKRYQAFVSPIVTAVFESFHPNSDGLDFGAGTAPVISKLLRDIGYRMKLYDPFFHPDHSVLDQKYAFLVCCEVIEHFKAPIEEFRLMKSLLLPGGKLFCMTELLPKEKPFHNWYYKNDPTHIVFYSEENLRWIKKTVGFSHLKIDGRLIVFSL